MHNVIKAKSGPKKYSRVQLFWTGSVKPTLASQRLSMGSSSGLWGGQSYIIWAWWILKSGFILEYGQEYIFQHCCLRNKKLITASVRVSQPEIITAIIIQSSNSMYLLIWIQTVTFFFWPGSVYQKFDQGFFFFIPLVILWFRRVLMLPFVEKLSK